MLYTPLSPPSPTDGDYMTTTDILIGMDMTFPFFPPVCLVRPARILVAVYWDYIHPGRIKVSYLFHSFCTLLLCSSKVTFLFYVCKFIFYYIIGGVFIGCCVLCVFVWSYSWGCLIFFECILLGGPPIV